MPAQAMGTVADYDCLMGLHTIKKCVLILLDFDGLMSSAEIGLIEKLAA